MFNYLCCFSNVKYENAQARFENEHTIIGRTKEGSEFKIRGDNIVIAVGLRPIYPDFPGALEFCITSDDIFSLKEAPGKTVIIGAGCILYQFFRLKLVYKFYIIIYFKGIASLM